MHQIMYIAPSIDVHNHHSFEPMLIYLGFTIWLLNVDVSNFLVFFKINF
jgi:hypothetical protein